MGTTSDERIAMTAPQQHPPQHPPAQQGAVGQEGGRNLLRWAIWVAIGALILAAIVCVVWVLIGPDNDIVGRAFLTILLLTAFAGVAILDVHLSARRPAWFALTSMITWVASLLIGAFLIWMPSREYGYEGFTRFVSFLLIVLILQLALLHVRLYLRAHSRYVTPFTRTVAGITVGLVAILAIMLVVPLTLHEFIDFRDLYWRIVVAITILAAVGTALIPLLNVLWAPKKPRATAPAHAALPPWPTYGDGVTPLPVLPDGQPDWNAYYTGHPTYPQPGSYPGGPAHGQAPQPGPAAPQPGPAAPPVPPSTPAPDAVPPAPGAPQPAHPATPPVPPAPGYQGYPPPPPPPH
jgi:hypothetical protein